MPTVSVTIKSINPKPGRIHEVTYEYTVQCNDDECARPASFELEVELTGADSFSPDDQLAKAIDSHTVTCDPDTCQITGPRSFPVATKLLDEDWGKDEIRLDLHMMDSLTQNTGTYPSAEFTGNF